MRHEHPADLTTHIKQKTNVSITEFASMFNIVCVVVESSFKSMKPLGEIQRPDQACVPSVSEARISRAR